MVLGTHVVIGGILGALSRAHPILAFSTGFISHFLLDAIPHWDYPLYSKTKKNEAEPLSGDMVIGKAFLRDIASTGIDLFIGTAVLAFLFWDGYLGSTPLQSSIIWGAIGGVAPDFLQFAYMKIRKQPLISLQRFHIFIHTGIRLEGRFILGPILQIGLTFFILLCAQSISLL